MAKQRHLNNAPIVEAIIDFRVRLSSSFDIKELSTLKETLLDNYPKMTERRQFAGGIEIKDKHFQQTFEDKGLHGYFFSSNDDKNVAQFRIDGLSFSRLHPYTEWETVFAEAKRLWMLYVAKTSPELVTRIAVRYINQMNIPMPIEDFADYLTAPPTVPDTLPQALRHFMTRVVVYDEEQEISANIIQALQKGAKPDYVTIALDIDVYKQLESGFEDSEIWPIFEQLRKLKNQIFFDSITEKAVRLFE
jgi:uncharacterized protein (TIGR04255 family)